MSISVIVPVYNEERRIATTLFELNSYLENHFSDFELIVVDDGSEDATLEILKDLPFPSLSVLSVPEHRGRGEAVRLGFAHANALDTVILFDADLSVSPTVIGTLIETSRNTDIPFVFTEPTLSFNTYFRRLSPIRYRRLASVLLGISHVACGTKCLSASFARFLLPKTKMNELGFDPELVFLAQSFGVRPASLPVAPQEQLQSSGSLFPFSGLITLLKIRRLAARGAYQTEQTKEWGGHL